MAFGKWKSPQHINHTLLDHLWHYIHKSAYQMHTSFSVKWHITQEVTDVNYNMGRCAYIALLKGMSLLSPPRRQCPFPARGMTPALTCTCPKRRPILKWKSKKVIGVWIDTHNEPQVVDSHLCAFQCYMSLLWDMARTTMQTMHLWPNKVLSMFVDTSRVKR